jgi:hypothetical protein
MGVVYEAEYTTLDRRVALKDAHYVAVLRKLNLEP